MAVIKVEHLTKDYGSGRGVFDISLSVKRGETFGFAGTNGAGKTTVIRHIMGFLEPDSGRALVNDLDCWRAAAEIKRHVGYIPGEIAFPDALTGTAFLSMQAELIGLKDLSYCDYVVRKLQLDPTANLRRMSKGMKQKTAVVAAFMHDPDILVLDEPTTGLDPLMRQAFVELLKEEREKGKTIFMSSHMFEELEDTCDRVALIKDGRIISVVATDDIKHHEEKTYKIEFQSAADYLRFAAEELVFTELRPAQDQVIVRVCDADINPFMRCLRDYDVKFLTEIRYSLEDYFKNEYKGDIAR